METKIEAVMIEIRDRMTCISAMVLYVTPGFDQSGWLLARVGFSRGHTTVAIALGGRAEFDPYDWNDRTMQTVHERLCTMWQVSMKKAEPSEVFDVEYILGETTEPKKSEWHG